MMVAVCFGYRVNRSIVPARATPAALAFKQAGAESGFFLYVALGLAVSLLASLMLPDTRKHSMILED